MTVLNNAVNPEFTIQEQLFKLTFENAAVGMAQISQDGRFIMVNNKLSEITGYSKEELLVKRFQDITHPDDLEADLIQAEALYRGEISSYSMEKRYIRKDGTNVWIKLTGSALSTESGGFNMFVAVIEDISEKKKTEEALHKSLQLYKITSSAAKIGTYFRNLQTGENQWSPEFLALYGLKPDESIVMKDGIPEAVHPEDRDKVLKLAQQHYAQSINSEFSIDHRVILPGGSIRWVNIRGVTERDHHKNPIKTYGIVMDISERVESEKALKENEEKFRILANNMSQLAWMMDNKGWVYWFNKRWYEYTGTTLEEMQGWGWQKVHHPKYINRVIESKQKSIESGETWDELFPLRSKEGKYRWFLTRAIPLKDAEGNIVRWLGTNTDVTHQRTIEKRLKNDSKLFEDLLYIAAHDLKGPVANMYGALDLMDQLPPEKKIMFLNRFRDLADQLNVTIQGVTDILHMRSNDKSAASIIYFEKLTDKILLEFKNNENTFSIKSSFNKLTISYIEVYLYSIVKNLISNSIKYCREDEPLCIEITTQLKDEYTLLSIRDNGIGIDLDVYGNKLFSPFQRIYTGKAKGTGIGLYLIKDIIEKNGGYITVESTPGKGTTFNCFLKDY